MKLFPLILNILFHALTPTTYSLLGTDKDNQQSLTDTDTMHKYVRINDHDKILIPDHDKTSGTQQHPDKLLGLNLQSKTSQLISIFDEHN